MVEFVYDKLIRDKVLEDIFEDDFSADWEVLKRTDEKWNYLMKKFQEEVKEFEHALFNPKDGGYNVLEEAVDIIEVMVSFVKLMSINPSKLHLMSKFEEKRRLKGRFDKWIVLKKVYKSEN